MADAERPGQGTGSFDDDTTTGWTVPADVRAPGSGESPASDQPQGSASSSSAQPQSSAQPPASHQPQGSASSSSTQPPGSAQLTTPGQQAELPPASTQPRADLPPPWPFQSVIPPAAGSPPLPSGPAPLGASSGPVPPASAGGAGFGAPDRSLSRSGLPPAGDEWRDRTARGEGSGAGPIVFGLLLILGGGFLLARELIPELQVGLVWPYVVIGLGLLLILLAFLRPPRPSDERGWR